MNIIQHASGSDGNFYEIVATNGNRLLVEIGLTWKNMQKALDYDLSNIEAAFSTHFHADHFREPQKIMKAGIDIYANTETFASQNLIGHRRAKVVSDKTLVRLDEFEIFCFDVPHNVPNLGFVVRADNEYLLFATDTSHISQRFTYPFSIIAIEASYDINILQERIDENDINETLAKRLLNSHMEKENTKQYIREFCDLSKCRQIHLLHCSRDNLDAEATRKEFEDEFFIPTFICQENTK